MERPREFAVSLVFTDSYTRVAAGLQGFCLPGMPGPFGGKAVSTGFGWRADAFTMRVRAAWEVADIAESR